MLFKALAVAWPILSVAMWFVGNDFLSVWFAILATFTIGALLWEWRQTQKRPHQPKPVGADERSR